MHRIKFPSISSPGLRQLKHPSEFRLHSVERMGMECFLKHYPFPGLQIISQCPCSAKKKRDEEGIKSIPQKIFSLLYKENDQWQAGNCGVRTGVDHAGKEQAR